MTWGRIIAAALIAAGVTVLAGRWSLGLFTSSEFVHFSINFPVEEGFERRSRDAIGGPWTFLDDGEWQGVPAGGLLVWGREGEIVVDMGRQGILKDVLQPWTLLLSTHWLRNVGARPYRVRLELDSCGMPTEWVTFERDWDERDRATTRPIPPGGTFNMDWVIDVPPSRRGRSLICDAELRVIDDDSDELLTRLPIRIANTSVRADAITRTR